MTATFKTSVRLPEDINARLNALAATTGHSKNSLILQAVREHLGETDGWDEAKQKMDCPRCKQKESEDIVSLLSLPADADLSIEMPSRSREITSPVDLS